MIKRILVALDPDHDTPVATRYATEIAQRSDAEVSGLAVVDTKHIATDVGPGGAIGGQYYAEQIRERLGEASRTAALELTDAFDAALDEADVRHGEQVKEGLPERRIVEEMKYHDLLVIGNEGHFYYARPGRKTKTLAQVVKKSVAPTLVASSDYRPVERVVLAYDGSDASARTMQRFAQLRPFGTDLALDVVHVLPSTTKHLQHTSELLLHLAGSFLRAHGFGEVKETSRNGGTPAERIVQHARSTEADLIVLGAHAVSAARRLAFGSTTHTLLGEGDVPLFLFH